MNHLPFTILAYLLNSVSVTVDKFLLTKYIPNPIVYVFYFSCFSLIALVTLPFTHIPTGQVFILASVSTLLWTSGAFCMFKALQIGQVSRVIPIIGTLIPLFLLIEALGTGTITTNQIWAVGILILGMIFLTIIDWKGKITSKEILCILASAILFALSYLILRQAYLEDSFLTVFAWSRIILIPVGVILLLIPSTRVLIFAKKTRGPKMNFLSKTGWLFLIGQMAGGAAELLLTFSVYLATPALVNSLQGVQYVFLFLFSLILARKFPEVYKERLSKSTVLTKVIGILLISLGLYVLAFFGPADSRIKLGLTYSPRYAISLGIDPYSTFSRLLDDLHPQLLRLPIYWDEVEISPEKYNFSAIDQYVDQASLKNVNLVMVVGFKQPRWPECFSPSWTNSLDQSQKDQAILNLVEAEVNHFKNNPQIIAWQVENEPFLGFGTCPSPKLAASRLSKEIQIVKNLDSRPILITDSGELGGWSDPMKLGDIFGTTLYRKVWSPYFGDTQYPLPPFFYTLKAQIFKAITGSQKKETIISELQTEPWQPALTDLKNLSVEQQVKLFSVSQFNNNVNFANETSFPSAYLWGVEWWYYMDSKDHSEYLDLAKKLFAQ